MIRLAATLAARNGRRPFRMAARAIAAALVVAGLGAAPAHAIDPDTGAPGYCPDAGGVTVVVDFGDLGGEPFVRCAPGQPATGVDALRGAGFQVDGVARWGDAFVCRIEGKPGPDTEACVNTPPTSAYWAYWYAPNAGDWTNAAKGPLARAPVPGGFEGWSFAHTQAKAEIAAPRPAPERPNGTAGTAGFTGGQDAAPAKEGGNGLPVVLGAAVIVVLGAGGALTAWRRRIGRADR